MNMKRQTYKAPTIRTRELHTANLLVNSPECDINTGNDPSDDNNDYIDGYDKDNGGWGIGSPE